MLLSDVPVFASPQQDNAARRFIALVDEFYDQGVKLVVSAAAAPRSFIGARGCNSSFAGPQPPDRDAERSLSGSSAPAGYRAAGYAHRGIHAPEAFPYKISI